MREQVSFEAHDAGQLDAWHLNELAGQRQRVRAGRRTNSAETDIDFDQHAHAQPCGGRGLADGQRRDGSGALQQGQDVLDNRDDHRSGRFRHLLHHRVEVWIVAIWQRIASSTHARKRATLVDGVVQTAWWGVWAIVWGPEDAVAQLGGPAVMVRSGSRRAWVTLCVGGWVGADEVS